MEGKVSRPMVTSSWYLVTNKPLVTSESQFQVWIKEQLPIFLLAGEQ